MFSKFSLKNIFFVFKIVVDYLIVRHYTKEINFYQVMALEHQLQ